MGSAWLPAGVWVLACSLVLAGCSKGTEDVAVVDVVEETEPEDVTPVVDERVAKLEADIEKVLKEIEGARGECDAVDAKEMASEDYRTALESLSSAKDAKYDGELATALRHYRQAVRNFKVAASFAQRTLEEECSGLKSKYKGLEKQARALGIESSQFQAPQDLSGDARRLVDKGNLRDGRRVWTRAVNGLDVIVSRAQQVKDEKENARALKDRVRATRERADAERLDHYAEKKYSRAVSEGADGQRAFLKGDIVRAVVHFEEAERLYEEAFALAKERKESGFPAPPSHEEEVEDTAVADAPDEDPEDEVTPTPAADEVSRDRAVHVRLKEIYGDRVEYENGQAILTYNREGGFQDNIEILKGEKNVQFDGNFATTYWTDNYAFAGHTNGFLLHDCVFKEEVTVFAEVYFEFVLQKSPQFQLVVMADGKNWWSSNFGADITQWKKGKPRPKAKPREKAYLKHPNKWVIKGDAVKMEIRCKKLKDGKMSITTRYRGKTLSKIETEKFTNGRIGFIWNNVRFLVEKMEIRGKVDEEWLLD